MQDFNMIEFDFNLNLLSCYYIAFNLNVRNHIQNNCKFISIIKYQKHYKISDIKIYY